MPIPLTTKENDLIAETAQGFWAIARRTHDATCATSSNRTLHDVPAWRKLFLSDMTFILTNFLEKI